MILEVFEACKKKKGEKNKKKWAARPLYTTNAPFGGRGGAIPKQENAVPGRCREKEGRLGQMTRLAGEIYLI